MFNPAAQRMILMISGFLPKFKQQAVQTAACERQLQLPHGHINHRLQQFVLICVIIKKSK
jgi:hypothetical protein